MDEEMLTAVRALLEPNAQTFAEDRTSSLWVDLNDVLDLCRFRIRGAELYIGAQEETQWGISTEGASWAAEHCPVCKQANIGQTGEYPCPSCGLPRLHDVEVQP